MTIPGSDHGRLVRAPGALWRAGDFGVVVLGVRDQHPLTLEGTGVALWRAVAAPQSIDAVTQELATRFAVDPATVAQDLAPVVDELVARGVLEVVA